MDARPSVAAHGKSPCDPPGCRIRQFRMSVRADLLLAPLSSPSLSSLLSFSPQPLGTLTTSKVQRVLLRAGTQLLTSGARAARVAMAAAVVEAVAAAVADTGMGATVAGGAGLAGTGTGVGAGVAGGTRAAEGTAGEAVGTAGAAGAAGAATAGVVVEAAGAVSVGSWGERTRLKVV